MSAMPRDVSPEKDIARNALVLGKWDYCEGGRGVVYKCEIETVPILLEARSISAFCWSGGRLRFR